MPRDRSSSAGSALVHDRQFWVLASFLAVAFCAGGSARGDVQSLVFLRPLAALVLAYALIDLRWRHVRAHWLAFSLVLGSLAIVLLHLVPLPPSVWQSLPGRGIIVDIDRMSGVGDVWRPLTMTPHAAYNAFWSMLVPLAVVALGAQLDFRQMERLVPILLALGAVSALLGMLQFMGERESPVYLYRVTTENFVGLFANRNHHATFLAALLPMLLVFATSRKSDATSSRLSPTSINVLAVSVGVLIILMVLVTGSRSGLALALFGVAALPLLGMRAELNPARGRSLLLWLLPVAAVIFVFVSMSFGRALSVDRLLTTGDTEMRLRVLPEALAMTERYLPLGSGVGSFQQVFAIHEPAGLLEPAYMNHVHNDWVEAVLTGGVPALLLLGFATIVLLVRGARAFIRPADGVRAALVERLGALVIAMLALASLTDYPLRVPSLISLFIVALLWLDGRGTQPVSERSDTDLTNY